MTIDQRIREIQQVIEALRTSTNENVREVLEANQRVLEQLLAEIAPPVRSICNCCACQARRYYK